MNAEKFDLVGFIMDAEEGNLDDEQMIAGVQEMVNSGVVWQLQGSWGRLAARMIENGDVQPAK